MTKEETFAKLNEQENKIIELQEELANRPEKTVVQVNEMVIENSSIGGENLGDLFGALSSVQGELKATHKGTAGHGYDFANLEAVLENCYPIITKHGISIVQMNVSKMLGNTPLVGVKTIIGHKSGGYISGEIYVPTVKSKMNSLVQMVGVSISYLRRYGVQSALGMATTDNDGRED